MTATEAPVTASITRTVSCDLDMNAVTAELYSALQHIENLNPNHPHNPPPATTAALPETENEQ
ncbi:hypothetical protein ACFUJX_19965 [Streptomyces rubiginosohelvolus]|uniref:hypothetical protein n=1 Tax=Streptomyces rubiginosohelvolus TaxID=67362 RepID=UPI00363EA484